MCSHKSRTDHHSHFIMFVLPCRREHKSLSRKSHSNSVGCHQPGATNWHHEGFPLAWFKNFMTKMCISAISSLSDTSQCKVPDQFMMMPPCITLELVSSSCSPEPNHNSSANIWEPTEAAQWQLGWGSSPQIAQTSSLSKSDCSRTTSNTWLIGWFSSNNIYLGSCCKIINYTKWNYLYRIRKQLSFGGSNMLIRWIKI